MIKFIKGGYIENGIEYQWIDGRGYVKLPKIKGVGLN